MCVAQLTAMETRGAKAKIKLIETTIILEYVFHIHSLVLFARAKWWNESDISSEFDIYMYKQSTLWVQKWFLD